MAHILNEKLTVFSLEISWTKCNEVKQNGTMHSNDKNILRNSI